MKRLRKQLAALLSVSMTLGLALPAYAAPAADANAGGTAKVTVTNAPDSSPILNAKPGWNQEDGKWYYVNDEGEMVTNAFFCSNDGKIYVLGGDGAMLTSQILKVYADDTLEDGSRIKTKGPNKAEYGYLLEKGYNRAYYIGKDGSLVHGFIAVTDEDASAGWLYADPQSYELAQNKVVYTDGKYYYFGEDYRIVTNMLVWVLDNKTGEQNLYFFTEDGSAFTGGFQTLQLDDGSFSLFYFNENGKALLNDTKTDPETGITYTFDDEGIGEVKIDEDGQDSIASPSEAQNAAKLAAGVFEKGINGTVIEQKDYDTEEKAQSFLDRLIDFFTAPYEYEAENAGGSFAVASRSTASYVAPKAGTADNKNGTDGSLAQELYLLHDAADGKAYVATASVAIKIKATPYTGTENPDPENPEKPDPEKPDPENPEKPDPEKPDPENPEKPDPEKPGTGGSGAIGGSGGSSSRSTGTGLTGGAAGWTETPGTWFFNEHGQWMLLDANGNPYKDTWVVRGSQWYYVNTDGVMLISWNLIGGKWYYFAVNASQTQPLGSMLYSATTPDGYQVDANGVWVQ